MFTLALSFTKHTSIRLEEVAGLALAIAGVLMFLGTGVPFGRRGGQALGGILLAAAGVLWIISIHWGVRAP